MDEFVNWVLGLWMCPLLTPTWDVHFWRAEKILLPGTQKRYQINCVLWDWILRVIDWVPPRFASAWLPMKNINWRKLNAHKSYLRWYDIYIYWYDMVMLFDFEFKCTHPWLIPLRSPVPWPMEIWQAAWDRGLLHSSRLGDVDCGHGEIMWECCEIWSENKCCICFQLKRFETCCHAFFFSRRQAR